MNISKVLVVDPDPAIRRISELTLSKIAKWNVLLAGSGIEALKVMVKEKPDLILLDVLMPGMDGPTILKILRSLPETRTTPVIFMTAKAQKHEIDSYRQMDAAGVITKPFEALELAKEIRLILRGKVA